MCRSRQLTLIAVILLAGAAGAARAETLSAVISPDKGGPLPQVCWDKLAGVAAGAGLAVLPIDTDPVTADVVFSVEITVQKRGERRSAACAIKAFEAATSARVATAAELGQPMASKDEAVEAVCKSAAEQLIPQLAAWKKEIAKRGMGYTLTLRWTGELRPRPQVQILDYLKKSGLVFHRRQAAGHQIQFLIFSKEAPAKLEGAIRAFLLQSYRIHEEPPVSLPSNERAFMYLLRSKK